MWDHIHINAKDNNGDTPLIQAINRYSSKNVKHFITAGNILNNIILLKAILTLCSHLKITNLSGLYELIKVLPHVNSRVPINSNLEEY